jgi:hypothetical protein
VKGATGLNLESFGKMSVTSVGGGGGKGDCSRFNLGSLSKMSVTSVGGGVRGVGLNF